MLGFMFKVSILHQSCLGFLVIGLFSPFAKPVRKIVKTCTHRHYTLVSLVWSGPNFSLSRFERRHGPRAHKSYLLVLNNLNDVGKKRRCRIAGKENRDEGLGMLEEWNSLKCLAEHYWERGSNIFVTACHSSIFPSLLSSVCLSLSL